MKNKPEATKSERAKDVRKRARKREGEKERKKERAGKRKHQSCQKREREKERKARNRKKGEKKRRERNKKREKVEKKRASNKKESMREVRRGETNSQRKKKQNFLSTPSVFLALSSCFLNCFPLALVLLFSSVCLPRKTRREQSFCLSLTQEKAGEEQEKGKEERGASK